MFSVRDTKVLEQQLREGRIELPDECRHNSEVIRSIIPYTKRVLPTFNPTDDELQNISDIVAYLMRPDILRSHGSYKKIDCCSVPVFYFDDGLKVHLRNQAEELDSQWIPFWQIESNRHYEKISHELFRCFAETMFLLPHIKNYDPHLEIPEVHLSNVTAFLLNPFDITDYEYTLEEINGFYQRMKQLL